MMMQEPVSCWNRERFDFGDLPTLLGLLEACDRERLAEVSLDTHLGWEIGFDQLGSARKRAMCAQVDNSIQALMELDVPLEQNASEVLVPRGRYRTGRRCGSFDREIQLVGVDVRELPWGQAIPLDFENQPEALLGRRVWLGPWLCAKERYLALAFAFWGLVEAGMRQRRASEPFIDACRSHYGLESLDWMDETYRQRMMHVCDCLNDDAESEFLELQEDLRARLR